MKLAKRTILGLSIDERSIRCAQVMFSGRRPTVQRVGLMELDAGLSIDKPEALGQKLQSFLQSHHMTARSAVVGVPARWVLTQDRELPPTDEATAVGMLRLQSERLAEEPMSFDVAGALAGDAPRRVMLVGILQRQLDRINDMCRAAGLKLQGVTPTAMAVAQMMPGDDRPLVVYGERVAEMVWQREGAPLMVRHLAAGGASAEGGDGSPGGGLAVSTVASELRRALLLRPGGGAVPTDVLVWHEPSLSDQQFSEIARRSGMTPHRVRPLEASGMKVSQQAMNGEAGRRTADAWLPAIAVALTAARGRKQSAVNLLRPRLVERKQGRFSRQTLLMAGAAAAVVLGLVWLYVTVTRLEAEVAALNAEYQGMANKIKDATTSLERFAYGRTYFERRPPMLDCLRELATAFGTDSSIWATSFSLRDNRKGVLQGRASNQQVVLSLRNKLQNNPRFADLSAEIREGTGTQRDFIFTLTFTYTGLEQK